ncbi:hypothetical protein JMJ77_0006082 [Colletotrichum scovillei]|uniref:Uncharacterized protein n=1 Tax=Colletotrichum scovillei TaxID=1209932 RepID=A0A9P7RI12_9PEZI|nr:hypothetical protein JMJ77_0006082 [Colletotrichum scovillei]KAG7077287.1 hypothetical protein JMJ76_0014535 [Colletotrichum scovillei]KAG7084453.1 hypothetical protein JMJ78_0009888 [Colletotrichum scovillei]
MAWWEIPGRGYGRRQTSCLQTRVDVRSAFSFVVHRPGSPYWYWRRTKAVMAAVEAVTRTL